MPLCLVFEDAKVTKDKRLTGIMENFLVYTAKGQVI
jgi:hypothetical protein